MDERSNNDSPVGSRSQRRQGQGGREQAGAGGNRPGIRGWRAGPAPHIEGPSRSGESEMAHLLVGGDSEIATATGELLRERRMSPLATTRRNFSGESGPVFLDLAAPLGDWQPPTETTTACIFAAVARLADCHRDPAGSALVN